MIAVLRVRGTLDLNPQLKRTLELLMLHKANHLVLMPSTKQLVNMVEKVKDFVTYGEIDLKTCTALLEKRGRVLGDKKIGKDFLEKNGFNGFDALAQAVLADQTVLRKTGVKPVFRLKPPSKGFERAGIKKSFSVGGVLGNRKTDINKLLQKMI